MVDGAGAWYVLLRIIVPLSKPVIATIALFTIVGHWNVKEFPKHVLKDSRIQLVNGKADRRIPKGLDQSVQNKDDS